MADQQAAAAVGETTTEGASKSAFAETQFTFKAPGGLPAGATAFPSFPGGKEPASDPHAAGDAEEVDSPEVQTRVEFLKTLQDKRGKLLEEYQAERVQLELKYQSLMKPLYEKRADVVAGRLDVKKDANGDFVETEGFSTGADAGEEGKPRGVPDFWLRAILQNRSVASMVAEEDVAALEHITDIRCTDYEDQKGFKLEFFFSSNPYFTNSVLKKEYAIPNLLENSEPWLQKSTGTPIEWRQGKNLTMTEKRMKPKGKKRGGMVVKQVPKESFFNFFAAIEIPEEDTADEEEYEETMHRLELDYTLASIFRETIVPNAVKWFTGEAEEEEEDDDEEDDEDYEEHSDDDDEDDDEEEEDRPKPAARRGGRRHQARAEEDDDDDDDDDDEAPATGGKPGAVSGATPGATGATGEQQECKQS